MTTHADHFNTNYAYSNAAYNKGAVYLEQLGYITGAAVRDRILLSYYRKWRFKHPNAADFMRLAEKESGLQLDWYNMYWVNTTKTIDYSIDSLWEAEGGTKIRLARLGQMPMPIDVKLTFKDGSTEWHYVPLKPDVWRKRRPKKGKHRARFTRPGGGRIPPTKYKPANA
jgi:aminopeptidase N